MKSTGYHKLEPIIGKPITYSTSIQVPSSVLDIENWNAYLEYANSCGFLEKIIATKVTKVTSIYIYKNVKPDNSKANIPQADDFNKIIQFPF